MRVLLALALAGLLTGCSIPLGDQGTEPSTSAVLATPPAADPMPMDHEADHESDPRMVLVSSHVAPTHTRKVAAWAFRKSVRRQIDALNLGDADGAVAAGYVPMDFDAAHWYHPAYLRDGVQFDPRRPELLVIAGGLTIGVMFHPETMSLDVPPPTVAPYMEWHYHRYQRGFVCTDRLFVLTRADNAVCPAATQPVTRSPLMAHVWLFERQHPFAGMLPTGAEQ